MKSNPKNYTLPLIREGVTTFIKEINTIEDLEKITGVTINKEIETAESPSKHEDFLAHAKSMLMRGPGNEDN